MAHTTLYLLAPPPLQSTIILYKLLIESHGTACCNHLGKYIFLMKASIIIQSKYRPTQTPRFVRNPFASLSIVSVPAKFVEIKKTLDGQVKSIYFTSYTQSQTPHIKCKYIRVCATGLWIVRKRHIIWNLGLRENLWIWDWLIGNNGRIWGYKSRYWFIFNWISCRHHLTLIMWDKVCKSLYYSLVF